MCIKRLNKHYAMENIPTVYDEDAVTALELCARTTGKVNECVDKVNSHTAECEKEIREYKDTCTKLVDDWTEGATADIDRHKEQVDNALHEAESFMRDNVGETIRNIVQEMDENGQLDGVLQSDYFATPQMYGAKADGVTDDTEAFQQAFAENKRVFVPAGTYCVTNLTPGNCEIIGAVGSKLKVTGKITYEGVYYPRMYGLTLEYVGVHRTWMVEIKDSYYGVFENVTFINTNNGDTSTGIGAIGLVSVDGTGNDNGTYYFTFRGCVFDTTWNALSFGGIANAHSVENCMFYRNAICIGINGAENIRVIGNTFQSFTVCGVQFQCTGKGNPISSLITGNYFEADNKSTTYIGDIDMTNEPKVTGNYIHSNHYTYTKNNTHIVNSVSRNMVMDYYTLQESNTPNTLMGFTSHEVLPNTYLQYGGERFLGTIAPIHTSDNKVDLYVYTKTASGNGWVRVLTTGLSENDTVVMPPIWGNTIVQGPNGYVAIGTDYNGKQDGAFTYDTNQALLKRMNSNDEWEYYQKVEGGPTENRPTWKPRGYMYYDSTLGKPIWSNGSNGWVDATGATV